MSWLLLIPTALGGAFAPAPVSMHVDPGIWSGTWSIDDTVAQGTLDVKLLPGLHTLSLGGIQLPFVLRQDGTIAEEELALQSQGAGTLEVTGVALTIDTEASWRLPEAAVASTDSTFQVVPGAVYALDMGQLSDPILLTVAEDGTVQSTLTAEQASTAPHRLDILTRKVKAEPQGYSGLWWTSAEPRTAQYGASTLEVVPALPYGVAAGLRDRFAFAFRVGLTGNTEVLATRGSGQATAGRGWVRFSVGGQRAGVHRPRLGAALIEADAMQPPAEADRPAEPDGLGVPDFLGSRAIEVPEPWRTTPTLP